MLIIVRGPSGSGKTTFAKERFPHFLHAEADHYFVDEDGIYKFNKQQLQSAHDHCKKMVRRALSQKLDVIVSNTFIKHWEIEPYLKMAKEFKTEVKIFRMTGSYENEHGVSKEIIKRMIKNIEPVKGEILI